MKHGIRNPYDKDGNADFVFVDSVSRINDGDISASSSMINDVADDDSSVIVKSEIESTNENYANELSRLEEFRFVGMTAKVEPFETFETSVTMEAVDLDDPFPKPKRVRKWKSNASVLTEEQKEAFKVRVPNYFCQVNMLSL